MQQTNIFLKAADGHQIFTRIWQSESGTPKPSLVIHINHGISEHGGRYKDFARFLVSQGIVVIAHDHRGHGNSVNNEEIHGHFADKNGWQLLISDLSRVRDYINEEFPGVPVALFGHSMGSFIVQSYMFEHSSKVAAVILSGSTLQSGLDLRVARLAANFEKLRAGARAFSPLLDSISIYRFNRSFKPTRTHFDWLSRDAEQVNAYIADPHCGLLASNQAWLDILQGYKRMGKLKQLRKISPQVPYLLFSGERDPISYHPKHHGVHLLRDKLKKAGVSSVTVKLFPQARHETLNEINKKEVYDRVLSWLKKHFSSEQLAKPATNTQQDTQCSNSAV